MKTFPCTFLTSHSSCPRNWNIPLGIWEEISTWHKINVTTLRNSRSHPSKIKIYTQKVPNRYQWTGEQKQEVNDYQLLVTILISKTSWTRRLKPGARGYKRCRSWVLNGELHCEVAEHFSIHQHFSCIRLGFLNDLLSAVTHFFPLYRKKPKEKKEGWMERQKEWILLSDKSSSCFGNSHFWSTHCCPKQLPATVLNNLPLHIS